MFLLGQLDVGMNIIKQPIKYDKKNLGKYTSFCTFLHFTYLICVLWDYGIMFRVFHVGNEKGNLPSIYFIISGPCKAG